MYDRTCCGKSRKLCSSAFEPSKVSTLATGNVPELRVEKRKKLDAGVDSELRNERGLLIQYSRWTPRTTDACGEEAAAQAKKVVVYLHSNSSCRLAVVRSPVVESVCASGYSLLALDFSGCGHSDGEYVTLGCYEQQDASAVVQYRFKIPLVF